MKLRWLLVALFCCPVARAEEPTLVPYRLTDTHHIMVRAKINGKGPFNLIVDTGCPLLVLATPVGKQLGLKTDDKRFASLDRLELEGGLSLKDVKARIETPFQIEGMNGMGLAGVELHGLLGYTILAKYRMQLDFTRPDMRWTPLDFEPPAPVMLGGKNATASMDMMSTVVRLLSLFVRAQLPPPPQPRGFFGLELAEKDNRLRVEKVLPGGPAAQAGLRTGDQIEAVEGKAVRSVADVLAAANKITPGRAARLSIVRGEEKHDIRVTAGEGL
jgi:hypothetical protein